MEEKSLTTYRIKEIEKELEEHGTKIEKIDDNLQNLKQTHNDRYHEISMLSTRLEESHKSQQTTVNRLLNSIDGLVAEMKNTNETFHNRFNSVDNRFNSLEKKVGKLNITRASEVGVVSDTIDKKEVDGLGNTQKGAIVLGIIGLLEVFIRYVAPLFFN
ncbi:hypothetical protein ACWEXK_12115 [Staphylococcus xylosus]|uniref:hypothetical protein n=1 Tax=Staphylococcus xylosus TaxID=1288 RepID=UPI000D1F9B65|nr:hypothetical protein [Staphylococcus xylosus]PTI27890.1 hypothetical protein BU115_03180 [Staphylococcus xylosus]HDP5827227.1 hypothetical protein [Staphylococcus aureus]